MSDSYTEVKRRVQKTNDPFWSSRFIYRHCSAFVTRYVVKTPLSATAVTLISIGVWLVGVAAIVANRYLIGAVLIHLGFLLDHVDGEVARYHGTSSAAGGYLDNLGHYLTNPLWFLAVAAGYVQQYGNSWVFILAIVAAVSISGFPRSAREHHVLHLVKEGKIVYGSQEFYLACHAKPWLVEGSDVQSPNSEIARQSFVDRVAKNLSEAVMFPGLLFVTSAVCFVDAFVDPVTVFGVPVTAGLVYLGFYSVITALNFLRTTKRNYQLLKRVAP